MTAYDQNDSMCAIAYQSRQSHESSSRFQRSFVTIALLLLLLLLSLLIYFCCLESNHMTFFLISFNCKTLTSIISRVLFNRDVFQLRFTPSINQLRNARAMNPPKTKFIVDTTPIVIKTIHVNWKMKMKTRYRR